MTKITIEIESPPKGYSIPRRGPLYLPPPEDIVVLIGKAWCQAKDQIVKGGEYWIYSKKLSELK